MSLKDLISTLIEAVFGSKKAFISNQAMPNVASHITLANNVGNETEFVAPSNGYVCLQGQSNAVNNELFLTSNELRSSSWGVNGWGVRVFLPIGKGQSFKAASNGVAFNALTFISSIGGGINRLLSQAVRCVRGGAICLKTSLTNCFCELVRRFRQVQSHTTLPRFPRERMLGKERLRLRRMDIFNYGCGISLVVISQIKRSNIRQRNDILEAVQKFGVQRVEVLLNSGCHVQRAIRFTYQLLFLKGTRRAETLSFIRKLALNSLTAKEVCHA